jgi:hypothetical protein
MDDKSKIQNSFNPFTFFPQKFKADVPLRIEIQIYHSTIILQQEKDKIREATENKVTINNQLHLNEIDYRI